MFAILIVPLALTLSSSTLAQINDVTCAANSENLESQTIAVSSFHFTWSSYWSKIDIGPKSEHPVRYCICQKVKNNSANPLFYSWPVGNIQNEGLPSGIDDTVCALADDYAKPAQNGPLFYGRRGFTTDTRVWKSTRDIEGAEKKKAALLGYLRYVREDYAGDTVVGASGGLEEHFSPVLITADLHSIAYLPRQYLFFIPLPRKKDTVNAHFTFSSRVETTPEGYSIQNKVLNLNPETAINAESTLSTSGRGPLKAGRSRAHSQFRDFLRKAHIWPERFPSAESLNFHQDIVIENHPITTTLPPVLKPESFLIKTPRFMPALKLTVLAWEPKLTITAKEPK